MQLSVKHLLGIRDLTPTDIQTILDTADQFKEVPPEVARRPFDCNHHVPQCESDAYAWAIKNPAPGGVTEIGP